MSGMSGFIRGVRGGGNKERVIVDQLTVDPRAEGELKVGVGTKVLARQAVVVGTGQAEVCPVQYLSDKGFVRLEGLEAKRQRDGGVKWVVAEAKTKRERGRKQANITSDQASGQFEQELVGSAAISYCDGDFCWDGFGAEFRLGAVASVCLLYDFVLVDRAGV